jgi:GT2 family glycosyltransferase
VKIAVVILNWNGKNLLEEFLPSVLANSPQATIYVADNASSDDSVDFLQKKFPGVQLIINSVNGGYAKGYNDALKDLTEDLFVLLNNDVKVTPNWLTPFIESFSANQDLVAAQPKILDLQNPLYFEYAGAAGGYIDRLGYPYCRGRIFHAIEKDEGQYDRTTDIFWATGACLCLRREAFWKVGGFDEDLFAHQEEIDLCWRFKAQGGIVKYIGASVVYHLGGGTLNATNPKKTFYNFRNTLLIVLKNVKGPIVWWLILQRLLLDGVAAMRFLLQGKPGHFIAILKAHFSFYRLLPKFYNKRKIVASDLRYWQTKSIVWQHFFLKNRTFTDII